MTPSPTTLRSLLARVEGASGADREIDRALMAIEHAREQRFIGVYDEFNRRVMSDVWVHRATGKWKTTAADGHEFTASVDAALALVERVLPGCGVGFDVNVEHGRGDKPVRAWLNQSEAEWTYDGWPSAVGRTPALAILAALLKALLARQEAARG